MLDLLRMIQRLRVDNVSCSDYPGRRSRTDKCSQDLSDRTVNEIILFLVFELVYVFL